MNNFEDFNEYQRLAKTTAKESAMQLEYLIPGLVAEAGEVADKYAKAVRDNGGEISSEIKDGLLKEVGDVLWFAALLYEYFDVDFEFAPKNNLKKLLDRKARGVIGGSGDDR